MENKNENPSIESDGILHFFEYVWEKKITFSAFCFVFAILSFLISLQISNQYMSNVLVAPNSNSDTGGGSLAKLAGQFGGLASLAGIGLGGADDNLELAISTLKSRKFILDFVRKHELVVPLMAGENWNEETRALIIDDELYDIKNNAWVRDVSPPLTKEPMNFEIYEAFEERLTVSLNKKNGFYSLSFIFYSPDLAKDWLEWLIADLNDVIRKNDIMEASKSIEYLERKIQQTNVKEILNAFNELIEGQTKTLMLANIRKEYVFKTVDPVYLPEEKHSPSRALIVIISTFLGGCLGLVYVFSPWKYQS